MKNIDVGHPHYRVKQIDAHTWCICDGLIEYMYLVEGEERAALIDTGMGFRGLRTVVEQLTQKPYVVLNTHGHLDHVGANGEFDEVYISNIDREVLMEAMSVAYREPSVKSFVRELSGGLPAAAVDEMIYLDTDYRILPLEDGQCFDLGGRTLEAIHTPGHTPGCMCFLDRGSRMLFSGDMLCTMGVMLSFPYSKTVSEFKTVMEMLKSKTEGLVDKVYPGHHKLPIDPSYMDKYIRCAQEVLDLAGRSRCQDAREAVESGIFGEYYRFTFEDIGLTYTEETR